MNEPDPIQQRGAQALAFMTEVVNAYASTLHPVAAGPFRAAAQQAVNDAEAAIVRKGA